MFYLNQTGKAGKTFIGFMRFFYLLLFFSLIGCSSLKKSDNSVSKLVNVDPQDMTLFEKAFQNLGMENYTAVISVFEKLAEKYRNSDLELAALYNLASALKELGQCKKAEKILQKLITNAKKQTHLKPRVYLSLSYIYECLGQEEKALIALKEGLQYITHLTEDIRLIEYPARLSLAYIRVDEDETGLKIQKQVYQNLETVKKKFRISSAADENFSRYFYLIGRSHIHVQHINLQKFLKMFVYYQAYLTQSLLLKAGKWSQKAEKEINSLYRKMWTVLEKQQKKNTYKIQVTKILNQMKKITKKAKNKKLHALYKTLRKKTLSFMQKNKVPKKHRK